MPTTDKSIAKSSTKPQVSPVRLRLGVFFLLLWWFPFFLIIPAVVEKLAPTSSLNNDNHLTILIMIIQTVIGFIGIIIAGKQVGTIFKHTSFRKVPKVFWHSLWSGELEV